jgi:hypothetical protein
VRNFFSKEAVSKIMKNVGMTDNLRKEKRTKRAKKEEVIREVRIFFCKEAVSQRIRL